MKALLLSILSGLLLTAGFPKPGMHYVAWVALVPLLIALRGKSGKQALLLGFVCGMAHYATAMLWIWHAVYYFGGVHFALATLVLLLLGAILAPYHAIFALVARRWEKSPALLVFVLPFVWVSLEWALTHAPFSGFPWTLVGYTQSPVNRLIQFSDITGVYGVSWLVVFANTVIFGLIRGHFRKLGVPVLAVCVIAALVYGSSRLDAVRGAQDNAAPFTVSIIQPNIEQSILWDPSFLEANFNRLGRQSREAVKADPATDMLFWPESALPFLYGIDERFTPKANEIILDAGKPVLFGTTAVTLADGKPALLNQAYLVDERALLKGGYAKQHLVPFGEYVPLAKLLFFVRHIVAGELEYVPGRQPGPVYLGDRALGVLVCYEVIFPEISRETVRRGAQALMNLTNDAWYGDTGGPYQHLEISRWRAIEFRVPLVRAANSGISAAFDATGAEIGRIPLNKEGFLAVTIRPMRSLSVYAKYGDVFAWLSVFTAISALIISYLISARRKPL
ncbi:MAG: apolipoprotein N-acyltransferase [Syntrophobacteraceae bacterium]